MWGPSSSFRPCRGRRALGGQGLCRRSRGPCGPPWTSGHARGWKGTCGPPAAASLLLALLAPLALLALLALDLGGLLLQALPLLVALLPPHAMHDAEQQDVQNDNYVHPVPLPPRAAPRRSDLVDQPPVFARLDLALPELLAEVGPGLLQVGQLRVRACRGLRLVAVQLVAVLLLLDVLLEAVPQHVREHALRHPHLAVRRHRLFGSPAPGLDDAVDEVVLLHALLALGSLALQDCLQLPGGLLPQLLQARRAGAARGRGGAQQRQHRGGRDRGRAAHP
mmetsp:Transcript_71852/g.223016  ORF Transcript_71852/g.223016 Transcript_71852/m.223016 type:complete len:279 (+) Transcript_71852:25-861(+)